MPLSGPRALAASLVAACLVLSARPAAADDPREAALLARAQEDRERSRPGALRLSVKGDLGYARLRFHGIRTEAVRTSFGVGAEGAGAAHYVVFTGLFGTTEGGRAASDLRLGYAGDLRFDVFRLGVGVDLAWLSLARVSRAESQDSVGLGGHLHGGVDLFAFGARFDHAVTLDVRLEGVAHASSAFLWGPSASAGLRW